MRSLVIGDAAGRGEEAFQRLVAQMTLAAPELFQVREKAEPDRVLLTRVERTRAALPRFTRVLVNGRPDVVIAAGADGVQLPADGLPAAAVRRAFPRPFLVGVSCHGLGEIEKAAVDGADFAVLAPIYASTGKPSSPLGPEVLDGFDPPLPVYVLGGMSVARVAAWPQERRRKVAGVAGIALFHDGGARAVAEIRALEGAPCGDPGDLRSPLGAAEGRSALGKSVLGGGAL